MIEYFFICPYCWQKISMLFDSSQRSINYIEDCEVCCRPIEINCEIVNNTIISFNSSPIEGN